MFKQNITLWVLDICIPTNSAWVFLWKSNHLETVWNFRSGFWNMLGITKNNYSSQSRQDPSECSINVHWIMRSSSLSLRNRYHFWPHVISGQFPLMISDGSFLSLIQFPHTHELSVFCWMLRRLQIYRFSVVCSFHLTQSSVQTLAIFISLNISPSLSIQGIQALPSLCSSVESLSRH